MEIGTRPNCCLPNPSRYYLMFTCFAPIANYYGSKCIAKEAGLIFKLFRSRFDTTEIVELSNKARHSASNLMLCKDSEFATAATGAMLKTQAGNPAFPDYQKLAINQLLLRILSSPNRPIEYSMCDEIQEQAAKLFTKLEEEFACKANDSADAVSTPAGGISEKPIGA
uniref:Uncharacterized protein n=1 Tax=Oryza meridionalis TaxID=40149 RepID=A0A0E0CST9_9ORYZ